MVSNNSNDFWFPRQVNVLLSVSLRVSSHRSASLDANSILVWGLGMQMRRPHTVLLALAAVLEFKCARRCDTCTKPFQNAVFSTTSSRRVACRNVCSPQTIMYVAHPRHTPATVSSSRPLAFLPPSLCLRVCLGFEVRDGVTPGRDFGLRAQSAVI